MATIRRRSVTRVMATIRRRFAPAAAVRLLHPAHGYHGGRGRAALAVSRMLPLRGARRAAGIALAAALLAAGLLAGCGSGGPGAPSFRVQRVETPAAPGSGEPFLLPGIDGNLYFSWIEPAGDGHALRFARRRDEGWTEPQEIASGADWFVNWADFPRLSVLRDGTLGASWLVKRTADTYAYDIWTAVSQNGGRSWTPPAIVHHDSTATEHGFVSMLPLDRGFLMVWLDGRHTGGGHGHGHEEGAGGPMSLRGGLLARDGDTAEGREIDARVCDCCPTDAVFNGSNEVVVVYRDRSPDEVRDISVSRLAGHGWSEPQPVHADGWTIAGCPVNGPAVAGVGDTLVVAWFTGADEQAQVRAAISRDGARTFDPPVRIDGGAAVGRVDVEPLAGGGFLVSWIEQLEGRAEIRVRTLAADGAPGAPQTVAPVSGERATGFPKLARHGDAFYLAWTDDAGVSLVRLTAAS